MTNYVIDTRVGSYVIVYIRSKTFIAEIFQTNPLLIKINDVESYSTNANGTFLIDEKETEVFQCDIRRGTEEYLIEKFNKRRWIYSGLKKFGAKKGKVRIILPKKR